MIFPPAQPHEFLTDEQKATYADLLTKGLSRLWDGTGYQRPDKDKFVCHTLPIHQCDEADHLRSLIDNRLGRCVFVSGWLIENVCKVCPANPELQAYRKAWMESMIKEFSQ